MEPEVFAHVVMVKESYLQMGENIKGKTRINEWRNKANADSSSKGRRGLMGMKIMGIICYCLCRYQILTQ